MRNTYKNILSVLHKGRRFLAKQQHLDPDLQGRPSKSHNTPHKPRVPAYLVLDTLPLAPQQTRSWQDEKNDMKIYCRMRICLEVAISRI